MNDFQAGKLKKAVTFSYDDAITQDVQMIELMNKYGIKGTFNLNSQLLGTRSFLTGRLPNGENYRICHYKLRPEDVKFVAPFVLAHRVNADSPLALNQLLDQIPVPLESL